LDVRRWFAEEQVIGFLREAEAGMAVKDLCRRYGFSEASCYLRRSRFGGMSAPGVKRLKGLEAENRWLRKLLAEQLFENGVLKDALRRKGWPHRLPSLQRTGLSLSRHRAAGFCPAPGTRPKRREVAPGCAYNTGISWIIGR